MNMRPIIATFAASAALIAIPGTTHAQIFVTNSEGGTISEYTTSGALVNPALITGLNYPLGIAVSGGNLFVANAFAGTIGEYTTSGVPVNPALVSGLLGPGPIAVSGRNLFVATGQSNVSELSKIGEYTTSGATVNPNLIRNLGPVGDIAVSGNKLFVVDNVDNVVSEYTTSGALVKGDLIPGIFTPLGIAISGDKLFITTLGSEENQVGTIGEYTTSGVPLNPTLITLPNTPLGFEEPLDVEVSGGNLFIGSFDYSTETGTIGEYTISGVPVNPSLISGLSRGSCCFAVVSASAPDASSTGTLLLVGLTATFGLRAFPHRPA